LGVIEVMVLLVAVVDDYDARASVRAAPSIIQPK
jgi:hypothetical protein